MVINPIKIIGKGVVMLGLAALFIMSIIGAFSLDLLLFFIVSNRSSRDNIFVTVYLWHLLFSNRSSLYQDVGLMVACSPVISAISIGLSVAADVPIFGWYLFFGWAISTGTVLAGITIYGLGDVFEAAVEALVDGLSLGMNTVTEHVELILSDDNNDAYREGAIYEAAPSAQLQYHKHSHGSHAHPGGHQAHTHGDASWDTEYHFESPIGSVEPHASANTTVYDDEPPPSYNEIVFGNSRK